MNKLVFLGDSVTDCSRKRAIRFEHCEESYGNGWVAYVFRKLIANQGQVKLWNRGFSGSLIHELRNQPEWWPEEQGQVVRASISNVFIGINDIWHPFWKGSRHNIDKALEDFRDLISLLKTRSDEIVVCEPFALPCGEVTQQWWAPLNELSDGQLKICEEQDVHWLGLQDQLFNDAHGKNEEYLVDGVHPTDLGHRWLSTQWLNFILEIDLLGKQVD